MSTARFTVLTGMVIAAVISRIVPHEPNFTPLIALALFGGAYFDKKGAAYGVPLAAMVLSDIALAFLEGYAFFMPMRIIVYSCFVLITSMGFLLRGRSIVLNITGASLAGSLLFFVVTNFAVWLGGKLYPMNVAGLVACYVAAIPFFKNMLLSTLLYSAVLFGSFELAKQKFPTLAPARN